jgi:hypothetical protein
MKTLDELHAALAAIERQLAARIVVVRIVIDSDGTVVGRIVRTVQRTNDTPKERKL